MPINLDEIISRYANILADVELDKNLEGHLQDVDNSIIQINEIADQASEHGDQDRGYKVCGYELYRLKDLIIHKLNCKS